MDTATDNPLKAAMLALRNSPAPAPAPPEAAPVEPAGPPPGAPSLSAVTKPKPASKPKPKPIPVALAPKLVEYCESVISNGENGILEKGIDDLLAESGISEASSKSPLTLQELKFVDLYLTGEYSQTKAMIAAGYTSYHPTYTKMKAKKILAKHESLAGDARKILRTMGLGEVLIAQKIRQLMEDTSKMVQLRATELAAKCLGMFKESEISVNQGIQIVIKGREDHSGRPATQIRQEASKVPPKAMAILK